MSKVNNFSKYFLILFAITGLFFNCIVLHADICGDPNFPGTDLSDSESTPPDNSTDNNPTGLDPVLLNSGAYYHREVDLEIPSPIPLRFSRSYNNQANYNGPAGFNWDFSYNKRLLFESNGDIAVYDPNKCAVTVKLKYVKDGSNYTPPSGCFSSLIQDGAYYIQRDSNGTKWKFDSEGKLIEVQNREGNYLKFEYDVMNRLSQLYNDFGFLIEVSYNADSRISQIEDSASRVVSYTYNGKDLIKVVKPGNAVIQYTYDSNHNITSIINGRGQTWLQNQYDSQNRVVSQTYNGATGTIAYDTQNNKTTVTDWRGYVTDYYFDAATGNQVKKVQHSSGLRAGDPASYTTIYEYNQDNLKTSVTYPNGSWIKLGYNSSGKLIEARRKKINAPDQDSPDDLVSSFTYETNYMLPASITDPKGNSHTFTYSNEGNLIFTQSPVIGSTSYEYNNKGQITQLTSTIGVVTKYEYESNSGFLEKSTEDYGTGKLNAVTEYTYNDTGKITSVKDPESNVTSISYNNYSLPSEIIKSTSLNIKTKIEYDADGNRTKIERLKNAAGTEWLSTQFSYDQRSNITQVNQADTAFTNYEYDAAGKLEKEIDAETKETSYVHDERGLLWEKTDALGNVTEYSYNLNGMLSKIKDAAGNISIYQYDDFNRLTRITYPDSSYEELSYDKNSNIISRCTRKGDNISYVYDALNRMTSKSCPDTGAVTYNFDNASRLVSATNSHGTISYSFDKLNRVTQSTDTQLKNIAYEYDLNGNRTKLTYPDNTYVTAEFDAMNRFTTIKDQSNTSIATYVYNQLSQPERVTYANGTYADYTFNNLDSVTSIKHQFGAIDRDYIYTRNKLGHPLSMTAPGAALHTYSYDDIYQLTQVQYPASSTTNYSFDALGNRTREVADNVTTNYISNILNQYTNIGSEAAGYDTNGNLLSFKGKAYEYDSENRLKKVITSDNIVCYDYDALDRRIAKRVYDTNNIHQYTKKYTYDGDDVLCEYDINGVEKVRYVIVEQDRPVCRINNGAGTYYYHSDAQRNVTEISDSTGSIIESYKYDVYGKVSIFDANDNAVNASAIGNEYFFTGRRYDTEIELYYYRARYYSPELGRFLQPDPIGYGDGMNIYAYCKNNPISYIDPLGQAGYPLRRNRKPMESLHVVSSLAYMIYKNIGTYMNPYEYIAYFTDTNHNALDPYIPHFSWLSDDEGEQNECE